MDLKTSLQLGLKSTANALRSNSSLPYPGVGNIELTGGNSTLEDVQAQIQVLFPSLP